MVNKRRSADDIAAGLKALAAQSSEDADRLTLLHQIQVYQEELIVQNEELVHAHAALEETRDRFVELYDFAPNGYLTLDAHGVITQINLTGATLIGRNRQAIEGMPLLGFVAIEDRARLLDFMRRCRAEQTSTVAAELRLKGSEPSTTVRLLSKARTNSASGAREFLTTMIDVTEQRQFEVERDRLAREQAALTSRLISVQDEERQRIARDLHDNIGQQVTALRLKVESMAPMAGELAPRLHEAQAMIEELDRQLDFIASDLRPAALDLGVGTAIKQFVSQWSSTFGIAAEFHPASPERLRLPPDAETHLYRVAQEALNNIYKHAQATQVSVVLERKGSGAVLIIEDNGRGFDPEARSHDRGLGLVGMRERAQIVGGALDIETTPGRGTTIYLKVPLREN
jgi:PAS domain S-box-containing protein